MREEKQLIRKWRSGTDAGGGQGALNRAKELG